MMPPYLTEQARREILPQRLAQLLSNRWFPAMNHICIATGFPEEMLEILTNKVADYFIDGPRYKSEIRSIAATMAPAPVVMSTSFAPDYGLQLLREGVSGIDIFFYDFHLFRLTVLERGQ
jgi:hypothetical protein